MLAAAIFGGGDGDDPDGGAADQGDGARGPVEGKQWSSVRVNGGRVPARVADGGRRRKVLFLSLLSTEMSRLGLDLCIVAGDVHILM